MNFDNKADMFFLKGYIYGHNNLSTGMRVVQVSYNTLEGKVAQ